MNVSEKVDEPASTISEKDVGSSFVMTNGGRSVRFYLASPAETSTTQVWIQIPAGADWETKMTLDTGVVSETV